MTCCGSPLLVRVDYIELTRHPQWLHRSNLVLREVQMYVPHTNIWHVEATTTCVGYRTIDLFWHQQALMWEHNDHWHTYWKDLHCKHAGNTQTPTHTKQVSGQASPCTAKHTTHCQYHRGVKNAIGIYVLHCMGLGNSWAVETDRNVRHFDCEGLRQLQCCTRFAQSHLCHCNEPLSDYYIVWQASPSPLAPHSCSCMILRADQ